MDRFLLKSKIHRATVTHADLDYEGSVTLDVELMEAADILEHERVSIWNVTTGSRFDTYALRGARHGGDVCINGAAAHHAKPGDLVIIASWAQMSDDEAHRHEPRVIFVDAQNRIRERAAHETAGPLPSPHLSR